MRSLVEELDHRSVAVKSNAVHQVVDVIAIKAARRRENDVIILALDETGRLDGFWRVAVPLVFRNELEIVVADIENSSGSSVLDRDGHASFRGDQAHVPHGFVAEELGKAPEVGFHRTAHPARQELDVGPVILGQQTAGSGHDLFKPPCNGLAPDAGSKPQGPTNLVRNLPFRSDGPIMEVTDQGLLLAVAQPDHGQNRARIGGDDRAQIAVDRAPQRDVVLRFDILDA